MFKVKWPRGRYNGRRIVGVEVKIILVDCGNVAA
jgi:hypothetical protein